MQGPKLLLCIQYFVTAIGFYCCDVVFEGDVMFAERLPVRLVLADDQNSTFTGVIQMVPLSPEDDDGVIKVNGTGDVYDHNGAGLFIVLVIVVYALSIVLLIASFIKKKQVILETVDEKQSVIQYLMLVQDLKDRTARENFRKLKMTIIEEMEHNDSRRGTLAAIDGQDLVKERLARKDAVPGITGALVATGLRLYQPLLPIREEGESEGIVNGAINAADTSGREDRLEGSPGARHKHVRLKPEPEFPRRPDAAHGCCTPLCPDPSLDHQCGNQATRVHEDLPPWPDSPETEALIHNAHPGRTAHPGGALRLNIWEPQLPSSSPKIQPRNSYVTAYMEDPWMPKSSAISSV